jgi:predicted Zn-dependent peptidase
LSRGKNSRLYKKFVYDERTASGVAAYQQSSEISSTFVVQANVVPGGDAALMEANLLAEINKFIENGPTEKELQRAKASYFSRFIKGLERIGGFGGKSDILASNETYHGDANYYKIKLQFIEEASAADLKATAQKWLTNGKHTLVCLPFAEYATAKSSVDRSKLPELTAQKKSSFPEIERTKLSNGLNIVLAKREGVSTIVLNLMVDAGYKTDFLSSAGTASLAMNLLDEGTKNRTSLQINEELQLLGASLSTFSDQDVSNVYMNTLKPSLDSSLDLLADVILNPIFTESEFERLKKEQINDIRTEKSQPFGMVLRSINKYMYGENHPYSNPFTGTGYETTVDKLTRDDMTRFYNTWMKPNNATLLITGDVELKDIKVKLEKSFGKWKKGKVPTISFDNASTDTKNTLYLIDRPESLQSVVIAGHLTKKYGEVSEVAIENMMSILGGDFTSRINMNLREDKHWSYGAGGLILDNKQERPFIVYGSVQTDKSAESIVEFKKEIEEFVSTRPVTEQELSKVKTNQILKLPGQWETNGAVNNSLYNLVKYNLPDDYYQTYDESVRGVSVEQVNKISREVVNPSKVNWFVVGDKEKIIEKLDNLGFEEIIEIDGDGNPTKLQVKIPKNLMKQ